MSVRELIHHHKHGNVPVERGSNPIRTFQDEVNKLFNDFFGEVSLPRWWSNLEAAATHNLALDVTENDKEIKITTEIPGIDAKDVQISVADGYVTIKGEKSEESKEEKKNYFRQERSYGSFQRVIALPDAANLDKAEATVSKGVLTIAIPKTAGAQPKERKIEIKQVA